MLGRDARRAAEVTRPPGPELRRVSRAMNATRNSARAYRNGRIKCPKTGACIRAVPLQAIAREAVDALLRRNGSALMFPAPRGRPVRRPA